MIEVRFEEDREKGVLSMELRGHAGFAELGRDPVCAGASVLAMTVAQCVKSMEVAGRLRKKAHILVRSGRVLVTAKPKAEYLQETRHLYWVGETGMRLLAETYPGYIEIQSGD
jgi:uncharacterized protein YsxB (DUF464 family)